VRVKSAAPISVSKVAIRREAEGCDSPSSRPPLEKLPNRAARAKSFRAISRSFIARMIRMGFRLTTIANDGGLMAKAAREAVTGVWREVSEFR
jgi:hypothetical protein